MKHSINFFRSRIAALSLLLMGLFVPSAIMAQSYSLQVGGIKVNSENCENITGPTIHGTVSFVPATRTLKLCNATINVINDDGIYARDMDDFTIELEGTNIINVIQDDDFYHEGILSYMLPVTITGEGTLLTNSRIDMYGGDLIIGGGCKVTAKNIRNETYYATGKILTIEGEETEVRGPVQGFANLVLNDDQKILIPYRGTYDTENEFIADMNGHYAPVVYIAYVDKRDRTLSMGDKMVMDLEWAAENYSLPVDEGSAIYNLYSQTLTLNNASLRLKDSGVYGLCNWDPSMFGNGLVLNIVVNGACKIWCTDNAMVLNKGITNITGDGKLTLMSDDQSAVMMYDQTVLNIIDTEVSFSTQGWSAIRGEWFKMAEIVNVIHSGLTAYSPTYTVNQISDFNLLKCRFQDVGGLSGDKFGFDGAMSGTITWNGSYHKGNVIIKPYELYRYSIYLEGIEVTSDNQDDPTGDGTFSFDPATSTLRMFKNHNYSMGTYCDGPLTLRVENDVTMRSNINVYSDCSLTITGPGKLKIKNYVIDNYIATCEPLTFLDADVEVDDIVLGREKSPKLEVKFSRLKAAQISGFKGGITLAGCYISSPAGARVENGAIVDASGNVITTGVTIERSKVMKGDVNGDGAVDVADIAEVISVMAGTVNNPHADVNGDGAVDVADIAEVITVMATT